MRIKLKQKKYSISEMGLSSKTYHNLAKAISEDVLYSIREDPRYYPFMMELISDAIRLHLGNMDNEVLYELSEHVMSGWILSD